MSVSDVAGGAERARAAWSQRVRRVGGFIQLAFAAFWLVRGALNVGRGAGAVLTVAGLVIAIAVLAYGIRATAGTGRRPTGPEAKRIERSVTASTVIELTITEHVHPHQEERFTITAGEAHFTLNGQEHLARAGDTVVVPAGVPHSEGNTGRADIEGIVELRPALLAKELHEAFAGLVADGNTTPRGAPKNPLQLGATFWHFRHESRVTSPPIWAQNLFLPPLWALAKVFGVRSYYERWDSREPGPS